MGGAVIARAASDSEAVARGQKLAQAHCSRCHAIGKYDESKLKIAPRFRDLHKRYRVELLAESLSEGIVTGHKEMPVFVFTGPQIGDFIAYLKTLEPAKAR